MKTYEIEFLLAYENPASKRELIDVLRAAVPVRFRRHEPTSGQLRLSGAKFRCVHCGVYAKVSDGGDSIVPFGCASCWVVAVEALDRELGVLI